MWSTLMGRDLFTELAAVRESEWKWSAQVKKGHWRDSCFLNNSLSYSKGASHQHKRVETPPNQKTHA